MFVAADVTPRRYNISMAVLPLRCRHQLLMFSVYRRCRATPMPPVLFRRHAARHATLRLIFDDTPADFRRHLR